MKYKGVVWTNHILQRMKERGLSYDDVYWAFSKPDKSLPSAADGGHKYYRVHNGLRLAVVAKKNEVGEWVMMTCWSKQLYQGKGKKQKHLGFWQNLLKMLLGR